MKVLVYGPTIGHGSFARVTAGMASGLKTNGCLAGIISVDDDEDDIADPCDVQPDVTVIVGPPAAVHSMRRTGIGVRGERLYLLPPNSTWVSEDIVRSVWNHVTGFIAPSSWAHEILSAQITKIMGISKPVHLWHHGVSDAFVPNKPASDFQGRGYDREEFDVLHLASTPMERKGTGLLLDAWEELVSANAIGDKPMLTVSADGVSRVASELLRRRTVRNLGRLNLSDIDMANLYASYHVVVQPSRGEGFGMIPLEASCCGVPVVATECTGHADHMPGCAGSMIIPHGPLSPIDDGPGAMAPSVSVHDIAFAIEQSYKGWRTLSRAAMRQADARRDEWSWDSVTSRWLESIGE